MTRMTPPGGAVRWPSSVVSSTWSCSDTLFIIQRRRGPAFGMAYLQTNTWFDQVWDECSAILVPWGFLVHLFPSHAKSTGDSEADSDGCCGQGYGGVH